MSLANGQTCNVNFFSSRNIPSLALLLILAAIAPAQSQITTADTDAARPAILVLGDSIAAGYGIDPSEAYPALLQKKIDAAGLNYTVINGGLSGDTTAGGLRRINWYLRRKIDVLILELGGNDGLRGVPLEATRTNLQSIIDTARKSSPEMKIILAGMRMPSNLGPEYTGAFAKIYPDLSETNHTALVPFLLAGVAGDPKLNEQDEIHPTSEGHKIVAENIWKILEPILREKSPKDPATTVAPKK